MTIFEACKTGDLEWLKQQLVAGTLPSLMQPNVAGWYPHELAAKNGHLAVIKFLVTHSVDSHATASAQRIDVTTSDNLAVRVAAANGHLNVLKWLVQDYSDWLVVKKLEDPSFTGQPVDVTAIDNYAVRMAAANDHLDVVRWLVQESGQPIDVTAKNNFAVCWASANGHLDIVKWLVEDSGQPVDVTADNNFARHWAAGNAHEAVVDYITVVAQCGLANFRTAMAVLNGDVSAVKALSPLVSAGLTLTNEEIISLAAATRQSKSQTAVNRKL